MIGSRIILEACRTSAFRRHLQPADRPLLGALPGSFPDYNSLVGLRATAGANSFVTGTGWVNTISGGYRKRLLGLPWTTAILNRLPASGQPSTV
jgi:hypothetical protein